MQMEINTGYETAQYHFDRCGNLEKWEEKHHQHPHPLHTHFDG